MNEESMLLIASWKQRSIGERDSYVKFFILYMCFDAWLTASSGVEREKDKRRWLINSDEQIKFHWSELSAQNESVQALVRVGTVENMHPLHRGSLTRLNSAEDLGELLTFLHQIRCNLFHGGKSPINITDRNLVANGAAILDIWVTFILLDYQRNSGIELGVVSI